MASAKDASASLPLLREPAALLMPYLTLCMSMKRPMSPVDMTPTSLGSRLSSAAAVSFIVMASSMPRRPVSALAFPLLITTAESFGEFSFIMICTGADFTLLLVYPTKASAGTSEYTMPRSIERYFTPLCTPAARNPWGVVTPPSMISTILIPPGPGSPGPLSL